MGEVTVDRDDLRRTLEHLDSACQAIGGEPCEASFVWRLRQVLDVPPITTTTSTGLETDRG